MKSEPMYIGLSNIFCELVRNSSTIFENLLDCYHETDGTRLRELEPWRELVGGSLDWEGVRLAGEKFDSTEEDETLYDERNTVPSVCRWELDEREGDREREEQ
jgi:hypothetical protein